MLPYFKLKILTLCSEAKKGDSPTLFNLMGQCFQDVGLIGWTNVVDKQYPNKTQLTKEIFDECIRDYLEAVVRFPNIGNQLICWLCAAKKPTVILMHEFMQLQVQLLSYLDGGNICHVVELSTAQENCKQIYFAQPKAHQYKFKETKNVAHEPSLACSLF